MSDSYSSDDEKYTPMASPEVAAGEAFVAITTAPLPPTPVTPLGPAAFPPVPIEKEREKTQKVPLLVSPVAVGAPGPDFLFVRPLQHTLGLVSRSLCLSDLDLHALYVCILAQYVRRWMRGSRPRRLPAPSRLLPAPPAQLVPPHPDGLPVALQ